MSSCVLDHDGRAIAAYEVVRPVRNGCNTGSESQVSATTLEQRVAFLEDHFQLCQLLHAYQRASDEPDPRAFAACFVEDAIVPRFDGAPPLRGRAELEERAATFSKQFATRQHVLTNPSFSIDGDRATGVCGLIFTGRPTASAEDQHAYTQFGASYRWSFRRTAEGWKIETREMIIEWQRAEPTQSPTRT